MKLSYKQKLFIYFFIVFAVFTVVITFFQQNREKAYKTETLRTTLDDYSDIIARYVQQHHLINNGQMDSLKNVLVLMPSNLRLTIVDHDGKVLYDNSLDKEQEIENHLQRPEIQTALIQKTGTAIRLSKSTGVEYYYFAKDYMNYFIRVALPYDIEIQNFLKTAQHIPVFYHATILYHADLADLYLRSFRESNFRTERFYRFGRQSQH